MPDAFTADPRTATAVAAVVTSDKSLGTVPGATASIPFSQIVDAAGQPPATAKQVVTPATMATFTTATCPVEKKAVAKVVSGAGATLPTRCPLCGYEKLAYS